MLLCVSVACAGEGHVQSLPSLPFSRLGASYVKTT